MWLSLRLENVLEKYGISDMIESVDGKRRIILNQVNCDLYNYLSGESRYSPLFKGSYLTNYCWGYTTLGELMADNQFHSIIGENYMSTIILQNKKLQVTINTHGAEVISVINQKTKKEYMWCGDSKYWGRVSPVLFPFVGKVNELKYRHNGIEYNNIPQHGFARDSEFEVRQQTETTAFFSLIKNSTWDEKYPFEFELGIGYELWDDTLKVRWKVINTGKDSLHFSIGAHPAFSCERGLSEYKLNFHTEKNLLACGIVDENGLLSDTIVTKPLENGELALSDEIFEDDALVLDGTDFNCVTLSSRDNQPILQVEFHTPQLGIWSPPKKHAPFVCIEPWYGRCDRNTFTGTLEEREFSNHLLPEENFEKEYQIKFFV